tara:strand:+ start:159 stop:503 length:345 start_codon:yes stop_codon:yes gene_type:complete
MEKKIVRIQKLHDIEKEDWKITFEDEIFITKSHQEFFELVEKGLEIKTQREIIMSDKPKAEETSAIFETAKNLNKTKEYEKEQVKQFREDVKNLNLSQFNKKYPSKKLGEVSNG